MRYLFSFLYLGAVLAVAQVATAEPSLTFGSYGRVGVSTDDELAKPLSRQVTSVGPRINQDNYLELDLGAKLFDGPDGRVRMVTTTAFGGRLPHESGEFDTTMAIRQAFIEVEDLLGTHGYIWLGSRMSRGDDIYLLDHWPMDDLNIVALGGGYRGTSLNWSAALGLNRPLREDHDQRMPAPAPQFGAVDVTTLNRQRLVSSVQGEKQWTPKGGLGVKVKIYSELHYLPSARRKTEDGLAEDPLPDDRGYLVGAQLGLWNFARNGHLNFWLRYANGLAAFDELSPTTGVNRERRSDGADEVRAAVSGNWENSRIGFMYGGFYRFFQDADANASDFDDRHEWVGIARMLGYFGAFTPGIEGSIQVLRPNGLNPRNDTQEVATVSQIALIPALTFGKQPGNYTRPQLQGIAAFSRSNSAAMNLFADDDPRSEEADAWYFGLRAEWWFGRNGGY